MSCQDVALKCALSLMPHTPLQCHLCNDGYYKLIYVSELLQVEKSCLSFVYCSETWFSMSQIIVAQEVMDQQSGNMIIKTLYIDQA